MSGKEIVEHLGRLGDVESMKDVRQLTAALFPGTHCPLMGAAMAVRGIRDAMILVVGTDECAYYTKHMTLYSEEFGGVDGRCVSLVLNAGDVTFGCGKKMRAAFQELMEEYAPKAVYLVTTCVVELTGEDMDSIAMQLEEENRIPVMTVHTEHFKCDNHLPGLERTMTASLELMEACPCDGSVNLLGQRMGRFEDTELYRVLQEAGIKIGLKLPGGCTVDEIRRGAAAKINLVVNDTALPLAQKMKQRFGIPYVCIDRYTDPEQILVSYQKLFQGLELPFADRLYELYDEAAAAREEGKKKLAQVTYIYGNTPFNCFELNRFMVSLGMKPLIIQMSGFSQQDQENVQAILEKENPYVTKSANIAPLQKVYDELQPMLYLGHEYAARLRKKGIAMVRTEGAYSMLGFEVTSYVVEQLVHAAEEARALRGQGQPDERMQGGMFGGIMPGMSHAALGDGIVDGMPWQNPNGIPQASQGKNRKEAVK